MSKIPEKPKDLFILEGISVLAFNSDYTQCALSKKDSKIYIYQIKDLLKIQTWELIHTLESHSLYISSLDWNPKTNKILSCSHDKTAYVWTYNKNQWEPSNVVASTKLGFLTCCWNKLGNKLALGTSSNMLLI
jgi:actin related protein 2/3 complex subunit 1A/1B